MVVTLKQIAEKAGVATSTVSFAIRGKQPGSVNIPADTVSRIRKVAKEMGYRPDRVAASLANSKTHTIGVLVPEMRGDFFGRIIDGIIQEVTPEYVPIFTTHNYDMSREKLNLDFFIGSRLDGVIVVYSGCSDNIPLYQEMKDHTIPLVLIDRPIGDIDLPLVRYDSYDLTYKAVEALADLGHKKILYADALPRTSVNLESFNLCKKGYYQSINDNGLDSQVEFISTEGAIYWTKSQLKSFDRQILDAWYLSSPPATALIVNDLLAFEIIDECDRRGIKVPDDLSIMGLDDGSNTDISDVELSVVRSIDPLEKIGELAAELLLKLIDGQSLDQSQIILPVETVLRKTTQAVQG